MNSESDGGDVRIGVLYPEHHDEPGVQQAEDDYIRLAEMLRTPATVKVVYTSWGDAKDRTSWGDHRDRSQEQDGQVEALKELGEDERLLAGATQLRDFEPSVLTWACTSGSFLWQRAGAERQAQVIGDALGVPATSTSLAFVQALEAAGISRVAVASVYNQKVSEGFEAFLGGWGVETVKLHLIDHSGDDEMLRWGRERLLEIIEATDHPDAEAVVIPETALHTVAWLGEFEAGAGKPVFTANQVTMWHAMRLAGRYEPQEGLGSLFRSD